jgi:prepilin-type N-terminal cleavage/methylation domain-containing protein
MALNSYKVSARMSTPSFSAGFSAGFTLVEMVIVLLVVGILAAFLSYHWPHPTSLWIKSDIRQVAQDIRYTQQLAMARNTDNTVYGIDFSKNTSYKITNLNPLSTETVDSRYESNDPNAIHLANGILLSTSPSVTLLAFDGMGVPFVSTGGTPSPLTGPLTVTLTSVGGVMSLVVYPETGYLEVP